MIRNKQLRQPKLQRQKKRSQPTEQTFLEHVYELRKRLFWVVLSIVVTSALGFQYKDQLISAVMAPLHGEKLVYLTPAGGFSFIFTLSLYFGVLLSIPVIVYHVYRFIQPILGGTSKRFVAGFILLSILLAATGATFGYFVTIPAALNFLSNFAGDNVMPNLTAESYLSFVVSYILGLAALFQVPLLLFLFDHVKQIPPGAMGKSQRFVIIAATIIAAVITPTPDAFNMMVVAIPLIAIYEVGVFAVFIRHKALKRRSAKAKRQEATSEVPVVAPMDALLDQQQVVEAPVVSTAPIPAQVTRVRTIDGVVRTVRQPSTIQVPSRIQQVSVSAQSRPLTRRSIDGFGWSSSAANV